MVWWGEHQLENVAQPPAARNRNSLSRSTGWVLRTVRKRSHDARCQAMLTFN